MCMFEINDNNRVYTTAEASEHITKGLEGLATKIKPVKSKKSTKKSSKSGGDDE